MASIRPMKDDLPRKMESYFAVFHSIELQTESKMDKVHKNYLNFSQPYYMAIEIINPDTTGNSCVPFLEIFRAKQYGPPKYILKKITLNSVQPLTQILKTK